MNQIYGEDINGATMFSAENFGENGWRFCERGLLPMRGNSTHVIKWIADMIGEGKIYAIRGGWDDGIKPLYFPIDKLGGTVEFYPNRHVSFSVWANEVFAGIPAGDENVTQVTPESG